MNITSEQKRIIHLVSDIVISLMLAVTGILFAVSCYSVYTSAPKQMFNYDSIGAAFDKIAVVVYITLALVIIGAVLSILFRRDEVKLRAPKRIMPVYSNLKKRVDINALDSDKADGIKRERRLRRALLYVNIAVIALEAFLPLIYLLNPNNFPAESGKYNAEILHGMLVYLLMLLPLAVYETVYFAVKGFSLRRETEILKEAVKNGAKAPDSAVGADGFIPKIREFFGSNEKAITLGIRIAFFGCAAVFIIAGIINGGMADVLVKAVNICAECIGLG